MSSMDQLTARSDCAEKSPITSLPMEILAKILVCVAQIGPVQIGEYAPSEPPSTWSYHVQLTLVCSTWRQVALHTPEFWATVSFLQLADLPKFSDMLARSALAPLSLKCGLGRNIPSILQSNLKRLFDPSRLREVTIHTSAYLQEMLLQLFPTEDTPCLETLVLGPDVHVPSFGALSANFIEIPSHVLSDTPRPSIRELSLEFCHFPWPSGVATPQFPNLVDLTLDQLAPGIPIAILLSILKSSPKLEYLEILNDPSFLPYGRPPPPPLSEDNLSVEVALPHLQTLRFTGDAYFINTLFARISHPPTTALLFICKGDWPENDELHPYTPLLDLVGVTRDKPNFVATTVSLRGLEASRLESLVLGLDIHSRAPAERSAGTADVDQLQGRGSLRLIGFAQHGGGRWFGTLHVRGLQELTLDLDHYAGGSPFAQCEWNDFFERHPSITTLNVTGLAKVAVDILQAVHGPDATTATVPGTSSSAGNGERSATRLGNVLSKITASVARGLPSNTQLTRRRDRDPGSSLASPGTRVPSSTPGAGQQDHAALSDDDPISPLDEQRVTGNPELPLLLPALRILRFNAGKRGERAFREDYTIAYSVVQAIQVMILCRGRDNRLDVLKIEGLEPFVGMRKEMDVAKRGVEQECKGRMDFQWV